MLPPRRRGHRDATVTLRFAPMSLLKCKYTLIRRAAACNSVRLPALRNAQIPNPLHITYRRWSAVMIGSTAVTRFERTGVSIFKRTYRISTIVKP